MTLSFLSASRRTRRTPFSDKVEMCGVSAYTVYNHMLLPTVFKSLEDDYRHLKNHVQIWDVACQRQVEISGPDSGKLIRLLTPRDLTQLTPGICFYSPVVDDKGGMINDPVILQLDSDKYWISIGDSDLLLWTKGLAHGLGLEVNITEPEVFPLAVQGPKSSTLAARVFGETIHNLKFFNYATYSFEGHNLVVARSGYSKQGGFEIYVDDPNIAEPLWQALFATGQDLNVRAGCPNLIERIEAGLLSYGNDMTQENNPYECGLKKFCNPEASPNCVGREALLKIAAGGPICEIRSLAIAGDKLKPCDRIWKVYSIDKLVGKVTSAAWSPDFETNVAIGMINVREINNNNVLEVDTPDGIRVAKAMKTSFI